MKQAARLVLAGLSMASGSAACAEPAPGLRGEQLEYVQSYAKCKVRDNRGSAQKLVLSNVSDERMAHDFSDIYVKEPMAYVRACRELVIRDGVAFRLQPDMFRAAIAEELVTSEMKSPIASLADRAPLQHWQPESDSALAERLAKASNGNAKARAQSEHDAANATVWLSVYGECVVRKDAAGAWSWIVAKPGSPAEASAIAQLKPSLGECLTAGEALNFSKDILRGTIAVNYYRLAKASVNGAGSIQAATPMRQGGSA